MPSTDEPRLVAKTASDKPDLLVLADYTWTNARGGPWGACAPEGDGVKIFANHNASPVESNRRCYAEDAACAGVPFYPCALAAAIPEDMPLGSNRARIDCRTTWKAFQDLPWGTYCTHDAGTYIW